MSPQTDRYRRAAMGAGPAAAPAATWRANLRRLGWLTIIAFSIKGSVTAGLIVWAVLSVA